MMKTTLVFVLILAFAAQPVCAQRSLPGRALDWWNGMSESEKIGLIVIAGGVAVGAVTGFGAAPLGVLLITKLLSAVGGAAAGGLMGAFVGAFLGSGPGVSSQRPSSGNPGPGYGDHSLLEVRPTGTGGRAER